MSKLKKKNNITEEDILQLLMWFRQASATNQILITQEYKKMFDTMYTIEYNNIEHTTRLNIGTLYANHNLDMYISRAYARFNRRVESCITAGYADRELLALGYLLTESLQKKHAAGLAGSLMRVYRTEGTRMRSNMVLTAQKSLGDKGVATTRFWVHTLQRPEIVVSQNYKPRHNHMVMNGQEEDKDGYFHTPAGLRGKAPTLFGVASEDINCRCGTRLAIKR